jgi:NAD(P)H-dependent FMN reductase
MIVVISGTNRPDSVTRKIARIASEILKAGGEQVRILDLAELPLELYSPSSYATKPAAFEVFQQTVLTAEGILTVTPEYNGSYPGVLKYFIDMLRFPDSLVDKPAGFVGLSAGRWGALRSVEQLEMVFQYRCAHLYGRRVFLPGVHTLIDDEGRIRDQEISDRLEEMVIGFAEFCHAVSTEDRPECSNDGRG